MQTPDSFSQDEFCSLKEGKFKNRNWQTYFKYLTRIFGAVIFVAAIYVVQREFKHLSIKEIEKSLERIPSMALYCAGGFTFLSFLILSFYDRLAVIQVGYRLSFLKTAFASFCSYVLSHNIGFSAVSGAIVRFRLYGSWGLKPLAIVQVIAFCSLTYILGATTLVGALFIFKASTLPLIGNILPNYVFILIGSVAWLAVAAYVIIAFYCNELRFGKHIFSFPSPLMAVTQIIIATAEVIVTAAIPYCVIPAHVLIPSYQAIDFPAFLSVYIASYTIGMVASVPGGAGVFEGSMLLALKPYMPVSDIISIIFIFRLFYYLIPLFFAGIMFAGHEVFLRGGTALHAHSKKIFAFKLRPISPANETIRESDAAFSVNVAATAVFLSGIMVLILPVLDPASISRDENVFLFLEAAGDHFLSFLGIVLLTLTVGLIRRITIAWRLSLIILTTLVVITLLRGVPLFIPAILALVAFFVAPFRNCYYRNAHFSSYPLSLRTMIDIFILMVVVYAIVWVSSHHSDNYGIIEILFSRHVSIQTKWVIALMAVVGVAVLFKMMRPAKVKCYTWSDEMDNLYKVMSSLDIVEITKEKPSGILICSTEGTALPFFRRDGFLVGIGNPVGKEKEIVNTIWRLRDLADQENCSIAFWNVNGKYLSVYQDLGLATVLLDKEGHYACCELVYTAYLLNLIDKKQKFYTQPSKTNAESN